MDADVLIIGGGPVGLGLAIELGQRGIEVTVVERFVTPQPIPKGQNLTQRTAEHFYFWGAEPELRAARTIPSEYGIGGITSYRTLLGGRHYDWLQRELVRPFYFKDNERLPQYATEAVLRNRAAQLPSVKILYGWAAQTVSQDEEGASVVITERDGGGSQTLRGRYAVGCDGSRSLVRQQAGITENAEDHDTRMVLTVFRSEALHELLSRFPGKSYYNVLDPALNGYWKFFGRVDLGSSFFFHAPSPSDAPDEQELTQYLWDAVGAEFPLTFDYTGLWDLRFCIANRYRAGRIFIAGDAAHSHPPYGGYGVNSGLEDARNIGWKLAATLQGWGGEALLDSYDAERRPVFESTARDFIARSIKTDAAFLANFDPNLDPAAFDREWSLREQRARTEVDAFEPNYRCSPVVFGPESGVCNALGPHSRSAEAGRHLAPCALSEGRDVYEALGPGFTLLALDVSDDIVERFVSAADDCGIPLTILRDSRKDERVAYGADLILIRPDQFVAWTSSSGMADPLVVLGHATGKSHSNVLNGIGLEVA